MAARNYQGKESQQSRERSGADADEYAVGSAKRAMQQKKRDTSRKNEIHQRIQSEVSPTRQRNRPQTGRSRMDEEGNQDTLE